jgi:F-type H+-transporting ATPase subunit epsilon
MRLTVTTPLCVVMDEEGVASVRAEDETGGFGILPGHADLLTVLRPSVLRWRRAEGPWQFVALHGGVLQLSRDHLRIATRAAAPGDDLAALEDGIRARAEAEADSARTTRSEQMRLQASVIRNLMRHMGQEPGHRELDGIAEALE